MLGTHEDRQAARAVLWFAPSGGIVKTSDPEAIWRGLSSLLKIARKRHRRLWAAQAEMAELVDAADSSSADRKVIEGSTPSLRTMATTKDYR